MRPVRSIWLAGRWWRFRRERLKRGLLGFCDHPSRKKPAISISDKVSGEEELDCILHEMLHASCWCLTEEVVNRFATDAARALTRLGYRRTDAKPNR